MNEWYKSSFGKDYLKVYAHRDQQQARQEIDFIIEVSNLKPQARVLDLSCGAGRHLQQLVMRGYKAIGLDLSAELLSHAKLVGPTVNADMQSIPFADNSFDLVQSLFTSIGYFQTDAQNQAVFSQVYQLLVKNGLYFIDYLNFHQVLNNLQAYSEKSVADLKITERRSYDPVSKRVEKSIQINDRRYFESVRVYSDEELVKMLEAVGFKTCKLFGDFAAVNFSPSSKRLIILAQKL